MTATARLEIPDHVSPDRVFDFDYNHDAEIKQDLHKSYSRLLKEAPSVFYTPANGGHWMVTRYDSIVEIVMDPAHFSTAEAQIPRVPNPPPRFIPLNYDPPENLPYRQILMPYFSPKAIRAMDQKLTEHANLIVDRIASQGHCEFVQDVAAQFPVTIFILLMGFPLERFDVFRDLALTFFESQGTDQVDAVSQKIIAEMASILDERRANPKEDLVSFLLASEINGRPLSQDELINMTFLLFLGGLDTVTNAMSFATRYLAGDKTLQKRLVADPSLVDKFVEEALRLFGVVNVPRVVVEDVERLGVKFRKGEMVLCTLPMAGWDDTKNPHPELFDIDRTDKKHLTFSTGAHLCLGHFLARAELKKMFSVWIEKVGEFRLAEGQAMQFRGGTVMALDKLYLEWDAKPTA